MPSSGGSVSDAPVNKVVDGQSHYLAYITPDEGKSLTDQGGKEVVTDTGIPAYPPQGRAEQFGGTTSSNGKTGNGGYRNVHQTGAVSQTPGRTTSSDDKGDTKTRKIKDFFDATLTGKVVSKLADVSTVVQKKAMTWGINRKIKTKMNDLDLNNPNSMNNPDIADLQNDLAGINAGTFTQNDYTEKYGSGDLSDPNDPNYDPGEKGESRKFATYITPYAAHAIGGTTQQKSMAAQWYANMGGSQGGFNLTTQYAAAKAIVAKRLGTTSAVGQLAVNKSSFFNFLKDNSLDKGIL